MRKIFKTLNGVKTTLLVWGDPFNTKSPVILCITGNPGLVDLYIDFATELHKITSMPLCLIGQAGHEISDETSNILENNEHLYSLEGQIMHKYDLISKYFEKNTKLHIVGHSIGAWLIVELLARHEMLIEKTSSVNLLFPTLQRMGDTINGKFMNNVVRRWHSLIMFLFKLINVLPDIIISFFIKVYIFMHNLPNNMYQKIHIAINPKIMEKVLFLAYNEMDSVLTLNNSGIDKIKHITNVIYSDRDDWAPLHYIDNLKVYEPHIKLQMVKVNHAFVLNSSHFIATQLAELILEKT
ncbi:lipid droplet-associated hydrolase [Leptidea sinapis]|uniref:lipid droplet-associated hydrolase n=1 Tax=Leptidea sinapis TaxID=189913 RepID=UPI002138DE03|nr:lipid droplet-associated hydrolase [Leptidea sinapis]